MIKENTKDNIILKITILIILIIFIFYILEYRIGVASDASRHFKTYKNLKLDIRTFQDLFELHEKNGSSFFLVFLYYFRYFFTTGIYFNDFKIIQIIITVFFYMSIFINIYKFNMKIKEKFLAIIYCISIISPIYIFSVMRFPLATSFVCLGFFFRKYKVISLILFTLAYYTHSGVSYIILIFFITTLYKKLLLYRYLIGVLLILKFFLMKLMNLLGKGYYFNKINSYILLDSSNSGIGMATTILTVVVFIYILYFSEIIVNSKKCLYRNEMIMVNNFSKLFFILGFLNIIFLFRGLYFVGVFSPYIIINLKFLRKKFDKIFIYGLLTIIIVLGILENRYLLNSILNL